MRTASTIRRARALLVAVALGAAPPMLGCATSAGPDTGSGFPARSDARGGTDRETDAERARSHYRLGSDHLRHGRAALAIRELRTAAEYDPSDPWVHLALAEAYIHRGHLEDAETHLRRALELRPGFQEAMLHLSALYIHMERYPEVVPIAQALVDDPTYPQPWKALVNLGFAEFKLGRIDDARRHLELAVAYHENYWQALLNLGILEEKEGRKVEALQRFERVVETQPGPMAEAEAHYRMALIYISMGNRERALEHLTVSASKRPSGPWGKRSEEYLRRLR